MHKFNLLLVHLNLKAKFKIIFFKCVSKTSYFLLTVKYLLYNVYFTIGSHTAQAISDKIDFISEKFLGISDLESSNWRPSMITDCGSNISLAIDSNKFSFWMKCTLHIINLAM